MKVYKFGGASVKSAEGVRNLAQIVAAEPGRLFVIVSAMGKTTNALEGILEDFMAGRIAEAQEKMRQVESYHNSIVQELCGNEEVPPSLLSLYREIDALLTLQKPFGKDYEVWYDRLVSYGELLSTTIVSEYLNGRELRNRWVDMRRCFITDARHKDANIDLKISSGLLKKVVTDETERLFVGQGFIGATAEGAPTTIGREGSDYSAAVAAYILDAESVTIWKDVEGILNADPKIFAQTRYIPELTYLDAIELAYSGAQIIHPKTIKPLQNKNIPLYVKPFSNAAKPGSVIKETIGGTIDTPILILKHNQVLLSIRPQDFSFVLEDRFAGIFALLESYRIKINLIQSSAVSLSLCLDASRHLEEVVEKLHAQEYRVRYNEGMELLTIRGYTPEQVREYGEDERVYLTQSTRNLIRFVRKVRR